MDSTTHQETRTRTIAASPQATYRALCRVVAGREETWADPLWQVRGAVDRMIGGEGLRRDDDDFTDPAAVQLGDRLDFWRVLVVEVNERLVVRADMKLPGEAVLHFECKPLPGGHTELEQRLLFEPDGDAGEMYWRASQAVHGPVFRGMLEAVARVAEL